jgi:hypothetical protein
MSIMSAGGGNHLAILRGPNTGVLTTFFSDGSPQRTSV